MKIRITQNTQGDRCWYANRIHNVFEVIPHSIFGHSTGDYVGNNLDGSGNDCLIACEDCEVIKSRTFEQITAADLKIGDVIAYDEHGNTDTVIDLYSGAFNDDMSDVSILYQGTVERMKTIEGYKEGDGWWGPINSDEFLLREVQS